MSPESLTMGVYVPRKQEEAGALNGGLGFGVVGVTEHPEEPAKEAMERQRAELRDQVVAIVTSYNLALLFYSLQF